MRNSTIGIFGADFATAGAASEQKAPEAKEEHGDVSSRLSVGVNTLVPNISSAQAHTHPTPEQSTPTRAPWA
eukprot:scaffold32295_cov62-Isochrysis_galbana.AAC.1